MKIKYDIKKDEKTGEFKTSKIFLFDKNEAPEISFVADNLYINNEIVDKITQIGN